MTSFMDQSHKLHVELIFDFLHKVVHTREFAMIIRTRFFLVGIGDFIRDLG